MKSIGLIISLFSLSIVAGCGDRFSSKTFVRKFGSTASPDGSMQLEVTKMDKPLVDFVVTDSTTGKELVKDSIGSNAMRWFLYWETPQKLWGYGSDIGYFKVMEFNSSGSVVVTQVDETMTLPQEVWNNMPSSLQKKYKAQ